MTGPMNGVKVIEMGVWVAGPAAGAILADWGADVLKIEPPGVEALKRSYGVLLRMASGLEGNLDPVAIPAAQSERQ